MKAIGSLIGDLIAVGIIIIISMVFMKYYEAKQNGEKINVVKEFGSQTHNTINDLKEGWNEAKNDTIP